MIPGEGILFLLLILVINWIDKRKERKTIHHIGDTVEWK